MTHRQVAAGPVTMTLGHLTGTVLTVAARHFEGMAMGAGLDGGEFSGPAHSEALRRVGAHRRQRCRVRPGVVPGWC